MRTYLICGTGLAGRDTNLEAERWYEPPMPHLAWHMNDRATTDSLVEEAAGIAGVNGWAILLRGYHDAGFRSPHLLASIQGYYGLTATADFPTLLPWIDTGALSSIAKDASGREVAFDFSNDKHLDAFCADFLMPFWAQFPEGGRIKHERSKRGRRLITWWGINSDMGQGVVNQQYAQRLLDRIAQRMVQAGLGEPDHLVDTTWLKYAPGLDVHAVHDWFNPTAGAKVPHTIRTHNGVVTGCTCPGFHVKDYPPIVPRNNGQTLRTALQAFRDAQCDYVLLEGHTDDTESAGFYRSPAFSPPTLYLDIVREHILATGESVPEPAPEPIPELPPIGGTMTGARLPSGKTLGVNPNDPLHEVLAVQTWIREWEELEVSRVDQWYSLRFVLDGGQLAVNEQTKRLERRPAGDVWGWGGRWAIAKNDQGVYTATCDRWSFTIENYREKKVLHLEQRGQDFVDLDGNRIVLAGCDAFPALRMFKDGGAAALSGLIDEAKRLGFTVWRVWSQGSKKQNTFLDLSPKEGAYYDIVSQFIDCCNLNGIIPLLTAYVDNQDVQSPLSHWTDLTERGKGKKVLWSGFNQWSKNKSTFDPWALPAPYAGAIWSRGSDTDDVMTPPKGATASELHATRISFERALMDSTASPPTMRDAKNGGGMIWMTEGNPFGDAKGYSEQQAWKLGRAYSIEWALAVMHNRQSQFGQLMTEQTAKCATAWVKGMTL